MADLELAVLAQQCLAQRPSDPDRGCYQMAAWQTRRYATQATVHWRYTSSKARRTLEGLYLA